MIPRIQNSERFLQEYKTFQKRISAVADEDLKNRLVSSLLELRDQIVYLDRQHESLYTSSRMPSDVGDTRNKIFEIRKNLENLLNSWERSQAPR
jgi:hypothetical protein